MLTITAKQRTCIINAVTYVLECETYIILIYNIIIYYSAESRHTKGDRT